MNNQPKLSTIEQKVQSAYQTIQLRPGFAATLRAKVAAQARAEKRPPRFFTSFRLAMVGITLVLILTAVFALGPQTILARAMTLFGFIPGVGFVEEDSAVHLCQPVEVTQNGVTLKIDQAGGSGGELYIVGTVINGRENYSYDTDSLVDPQGNEAKLLNYRGGGGEELYPSEYPFEAVFRLPSASRTWTMPFYPDGEPGAVLALCPGSQPTTSGSTAASLYTPSDAVARGKGMIFQIKQVAQQNEITAIQVETLLDEGSALLGVPQLIDWYQDKNSQRAPNVELTDDLGNHYALRQQIMPSVIGDPVTSFEFDPISAEARRATLRIQQIDLGDRTTVPFELDLGGVPQPGQTWDLEGKPGSEYQIKGYTISLLSARYTKEHEKASYFSPVDRDVYALEFTAKVTAPTKDYLVQFLKLELGSDNYMFMSDGILRPKAYFAHPLTDEPVTGSIGWLGGIVKGPWEIQWDLPQ